MPDELQDRRSRKKRISLLEGYGAYRDDRLEGISKKIADINQQESELPAKPTENTIIESDDSSCDTADDTTSNTTYCPAIPPTVRLTVPPAAHPSKHPAGYLTAHPTHHPTFNPTVHPASNDFASPFIGMTTKQIDVLIFLINQESRITCKSQMTSLLQISDPTLKGILKALKDKGFLLKTQRYVNGQFQGLQYVLDNKLCSDFIEYYERASAGLGNPADRPTRYPSIQPTLHPALHPTSDTSLASSGASSRLYSSSSLCRDTTTKSSSAEEMLASHPEFGYWRQKGLTAKQIEAWMVKTGASLEGMVQSLCHCRYEMVDLGAEESKPVDNVFNWFFRIIERVGHYPAPKGYKSFRQKELELERNILEEKERSIQELRAIREKKRELELELSFQQMMQDQDGNIFQSCLKRIPPGLVKQTDRTSRSFEILMHNAFDEYVEEQEKTEMS